MPTMIVGLDLAKHVFQVHAVDPAGKVTIRKKLRRSEVLEFFKGLPPSLVGMEACGTAHYWGRELTALGHDVRLMPAGYVKPYVKRGKNDAVDAEAICEAVTRPTMRFVEIKSAEQQSGLMLHRTRELLVRQRTALINSLRGQLAEFGLIAPKGVWSIPDLHALAQGATPAVLPDAVRSCVELIMGQIDDLQSRTDDREGYSSSAPGQRGQPPAANNPRNRRDHGFRHHCYHRRHQGLQIRATSGSLDRPCPTAVRIRRQGLYGEDIEERRRVFAQASRARRHCGDPLLPQQARACRLDQRAPPKASTARGHDRGGQQDGKDRVGGDEPRRDVPPGSLRHRISGSSRKGEES